MHLGETEFELLLAECDHRVLLNEGLREKKESREKNFRGAGGNFLGLPVAVAHFADHPQQRVFGHVLHLPDQLRERLGVPADDRLQVAADLPGQGEHDVGVFTQFLRQRDGGLFRGRGQFIAFEFGQVRRRHAGPLSDLAQREPPIGLTQPLPGPTEVVAKGGGHV